MNFMDQYLFIHRCDGYPYVDMSFERDSEDALSQSTGLRSGPILTFFDGPLLGMKPGNCPMNDPLKMLFLLISRGLNV